jgi:hypothetical protein
MLASMAEQIRRMMGFLVLACTTFACIGVGYADVSPAIAWPTRGWDKATPASVGLDDRTLVDLDADFAAGKYVHS